jgi:hypothetical protein
MAGARASGMRFSLLRAPPQLLVGLSWRNLYERYAFAQRELVTDSNLRSMARERSLSIRLGQEALEYTDETGALRPIAFGGGAYMTGMPPQPGENITFREEQPMREWSNYAWDAWGHPTVSSLYSPWQILYVDGVVEGAQAEVPLNVVLRPAGERDRLLVQLDGWYRGQDTAWRSLDEGWAPLMKVLVRLQNQYWPQVSGRVQLSPDLENEGGWIEAGRTADPEDAHEILSDLGCTEEELLASYHFLVDRGFELEPQDGAMLLRRAKPRAFHIRWRGLPRRAQDHFDAAEMIRRFLMDLTGENPPRTPMWPMDGRQVERATLYDLGPAGPVPRERISEELIATELRPAQVHLAGEGESEQIVVDVLIQAVLGPAAPKEQIPFYDLRGSGGARLIAPFVDALRNHDVRVFAILDREGKAYSHLTSAIRAGDLHKDDVCLFDNSLERANATTDELISLAAELARNRTEEGRPSVTLRLTAQELESYHVDRCERSSRGDKPGLADSLITMARWEQHGPVELEKLELVEALARMLAEEFDNTPSEKREELYERRPVVSFVVRRIAPPLSKSRPLG